MTCRRHKSETLGEISLEDNICHPHIIHTSSAQQLCLKPFGFLVVITIAITIHPIERNRIRNGVVNLRCEWSLMLYSRCSEIHTQKCRWLWRFYITLQNIWHHITAYTHGLSVCFIYLVNQHHIPATSTGRSRVRLLDRQTRVRPHTAPVTQPVTHLCKRRAMGQFSYETRCTMFRHLRVH